MRSRKVQAFFCAALLAASLLALAGCGGQTEVSYSPNAAYTGSFQYYYVGDSKLYQGAKNSFQVKQPGLAVDAVAFTDEQQLADRVAAEMASGKGPDAILLDSGSLLDLAKLTKSGALLDLRPYMDDDGSYKRDDYFAALMDAGCSDGKQTAVPFSFYVNIFNTTEERLAARGVDASQITDANAFLSMIVSQSAEETDDTYTFYRTGSPEYNFASLLDSCGIRLVKEDLSGIGTDKDTLKLACDACRVIESDSARIDAAYKRDKSDENIYNNVFGICTVKKFPIYSWLNKTVFYHLTGETERFIPVPAVSGGSVCLRAELYGVVNANTKNPDAAYAFLRCIMDETIPSTKYYELPVSRSGADDYISRCLSNDMPKIHVDGNAYSYVPITENDLKPVRGVLEDAKYGVIANQTQLAVADDCMEPYITGNKSFDDCYSELENRLQLYLSE